MSYYLMIENNKIIGSSQCLSGGDITDVEVSEEVYNAYVEDNDRYIWNGEEIIENPDYEEIKRQKEQVIIDNLTMTALDFINFLKTSGITDVQIEAYLNANLNVKHQLQFCQNVYCGVAKSLMPVSVGDITITAEMVETAFKVKNGILDQ
ncbi:hypothetical protein IKP85_04905 [bacterium]|nr:hypothetical protein [bacterium]